MNAVAYAVGLVLVEALVLAAFSGQFLVAAVFGLAAVLAALRPPLVLGTARFFAAVALLLLAFSAKAVLAPSGTEELSAFVSYDAARACAEWLISVQILMLACRPTHGAIRPFFALLGVVALSSAGNMLADNSRTALFQLASIAYVLLAAGLFSAPRRASAGTLARPPRAFPYRPSSRALATAVVLVLTALFAGLGSEIAASYWNDLERYLEGRPRDAAGAVRLGFSSHAGLNSIAADKLLQSDQTAVRVIADEAPGYLRGRAYETWSGRTWDASPERQPIFPTHQPPDELPPSLRGRPVFRLGPGRGPWRRLEVWPASPALQPLLAPLGTAIVEAAADRLELDSSGAVPNSGLPPYAGYVLHVSRAPVPPAQADPQRLARLTEIPRTLHGHPVLDRLHDELFSGVAFDAGSDPALVTRRRIEILELFFRGNFQYRLGIDVPDHGDPIAWFLERRPAAHCEFFASAAVVMLRRAGIPARYVTGYVAAERNKHGGYWIARQRDAHAWAEAYVPGTGWVVVECTPAEGVPQERADSSFSQFADDLRLRTQQFLNALWHGGSDGLRDALAILAAALLDTWPGRAAAALFLLALYGALRRKQSLSRPRTTADRPFDPPWDQWLARLDRQAARWQLVRRHDETLHAFADRLRRARPMLPASAATTVDAAADGYERYAAARYAGLPPVESAVRHREIPP